MSSNTIDLARRLAELGQKEEAQQAYLMVLQEVSEKQPELEMEAASYIFFQRAIIKSPTQHLFLYIIVVAIRLN